MTFFFLVRLAGEHVIDYIGTEELLTKQTTEMLTLQARVDICSRVFILWWPNDI